MKLNKKLYTLIVFIAGTTSLFAQINPYDVQYFQNRYLANPAMAGFEQGTHLNLGYRNQWSNMPGSPRNQSVSIETRNNRVGLGLNVNNDKAGLINYTKAVATYAYHLPLNGQKQALHFGLNFGFQKGNLNSQQVVGDANDPDLVSFNNREVIIDADFGMAYTSEKFGFEAAFYNLKSQLKSDLKNTAENHIYYFAADYAFPVSTWSVKSKIAYRGVRNYTDIFDIGVNVISANQKLGFTTIYHTNKSTSLGISYQHNQKWQLLSVYNTSAQAINNYANGTFEVALRVNLTKKQ